MAAATCCSAWVSTPSVIHAATFSVAVFTVRVLSLVVLATVRLLHSCRFSPEQRRWTELRSDRGRNLAGHARIRSQSPPLDGERHPSASADRSGFGHAAG